MKKLFFYCLFLIIASSCSKNEGHGIDPNGRPRDAPKKQPAINEENKTGDGGAFIDPFGKQ